MTTTQMRYKVVSWIEEAIEKGAGKEKACEIVGISIRTLQRWKPVGSHGVIDDQRPIAKRPEPANKLSVQERQKVLNICNQEAYASLPPSQIIPKLADKGVYVASESTFYRILRVEGQLEHRGRTKRPCAVSVPQNHVADAPNQVWTWDISLLPSIVRGQYFYLYMVEDLYSRYGVMWEVHECESGQLAAELVEKAVLREGCHTQRPVLHSDNGSPMKCQTMRLKLQELGIVPSHSRPGVSDDNAYVESFFRTLKYCPKWPVKGFVSLEDARKWVQEFMYWYNHEHQHSQIRFVTPAQRHRGEDRVLLVHREMVYAAAKTKHPQRWSGTTRNWTPVGSVALNPIKKPLEKVPNHVSAEWKVVFQEVDEEVRRSEL